MSTFKKDKTHHTRLRAQATADAATMRAYRSSGTKMIAAGRKMRQWAKTNDNPEALVESIKLTDGGVYLRGYTEGNRELHLALALLNGTPYVKCEASPRTPPNRGKVCRVISNTIPLPEAQRRAIVDAWFDGTDVKPAVTETKPTGIFGRLREAVVGA